MSSSSLYIADKENMPIARYWSLVLGFLLVSVMAPSQAQSGYPIKPVKFIVAFPPGQATDLVARILADGLTKVWQQSVVVENRPGGAGIPATVAARDAPADGYTLAMGSSGTIAANVSLFPKLPYDPRNDFTMIGGVFIAPVVLVAHPNSPYKKFRDVIDSAKAAPGSINWAVPGIGGAQHISGAILKSRAGVDIADIFYKGSAPAMQDLLGGQIPLLWDSVAAVMPHIRSGRVKPLAVTTAQRVPQLPNVPTVAELGYPGFENAGWGGLIAPKATPVAIVEKIAVDTRRLLAEPAFRDRLIDAGLIVDLRGSKDWTEFVEVEIKKIQEITQQANIKLE